MFVCLFMCPQALLGEFIWRKKLCCQIQTKTNFSILMLLLFTLLSLFSISLLCISNLSPYSADSCASFFPQVVFYSVGLK